MDFSPSFVTDVREIVVSHPDYGPVTSLESLSGRQVYVHASSSYYESLEAANQGLRKAGLAPIDVQKIDENLHLGGILEMVHAGILPATVADEHVARFWHQVFPKLVLHSEAVLREKGDIAWVIRKNSPQLQRLLEGFVKRHGAGTAYQRQLSERHLKGKKLITNPSATANFKRFQSLLPLFRKYGAKYQLDPLMLAAQGYQESGLRQDAVSHVGAIGVMQIMPATGADLRVGDISLLEPNVHGGAKYMRQIINRYLATNEVAKVDQMLFALAAYNAGPNRVNRLRGVAEKEGLDANRWFNHTERIVARKVGREPIRYVRNIYRYYLAYRIALDQGAAPDKP